MTTAKPTTRAARPFVILSALLFFLAGSVAADASSTDVPSEDAPFPAELPVFKVLDDQHVPVPSSRFKKGVVLLDFWASWCRPCHFTLPELERLHREYGERDDFAVVGISIDEGRSGAVRARRFAERAGVTYDAFHDNASTQAKPQLKIEAVPVLFLVQEGKVLKRWNGEPDFSEVEEEIRKTLGLPSLSEE